MKDPKKDSTGDGGGAEDLELMSRHSDAVDLGGLGTAARMNQRTRTLSRVPWMAASTSLFNSKVDSHADPS